MPNGTIQTYDCNCSNCNPHDCHGCHQYEYQAQPSTISKSFSGSCGYPSSGGCTAKGPGGGNLSQEQCRERAATCGGINPPPPECGSSPPLGNCKNGSGSSPTLVAGSTDTYQWTCSVGSLSTTCTGTTNPPTCDINIHGAACCPVSSGGTCTGQFCVVDCQTPETCHVKDTGDGVCRPSCGTLIIAQGYTYGALPSPSVNGFNDCAHLNAVQHEGSTDWFKVPLIEGKEPWEVIEYGGGECCTRGTCDSSVECCPGDSHPSNSHCSPTTDDCSCTDNGCSAGCDKDTNTDGTWICESQKGGTDSGTCKGKCDSSKECCDGDSSPSNPNCGPCTASPPRRTAAESNINFRVCGRCHADWRHRSPATCTFKLNRWHKKSKNTPKDKKKGGVWYSCHTEYNCSYNNEDTVCWRHHGKGPECTYHK